MELSDSQVATMAVEAGARVVARDYGSDHQRHFKSATDFATATDVEAEGAILSVLAAHRPGDGRIGEESGETGDLAATRRWLIDPLCGTSNFAATTPLCAVNVALSADGGVRVAAVMDPISSEIFWTDGAASYLRDARGDVRLSPSAVSTLVDINCDGPLDVPFVGGQLIADPRVRAVFGPRVTSSTLAVAWVAAGRRAAYVSDGAFRDNNVHFAAGIAVCRSAGCIISDLAGGTMQSGRGLVISADQVTHAKLLALIAPHLSDALTATSSRA